MLRLITVLSALSCVFATPSVTLNPDNVITIKGPINKDTASEFIYGLNKIENKQDIFVFIDTPGGSVDDGMKMFDEIDKFNMTCIAQRAYSMGFTILQACAKRFITPYATLMQHQMSYGLRGEKEKLENYAMHVKDMDDRLTQIQARKIGITDKEFKDKTYNDWWLFGEKILRENCADDFLYVSCSPELTNTNYTYLGNVYSGCPLVSEPIVKKQTGFSLSDLFREDERFERPMLFKDSL